ncbi:MAG: DUF3095 domain-containing protein [Sedimentitalea sp.]
MDQQSDSIGFYDRLQPLAAFSDLADPGRYAPLPDDWWVGVSDIVGSTQAVADGKYKTVNMIGAAVISAQINANAGRAFPFVFGGDGAVFACPPDQRDAAEAALAAVQSWAKAEFDMGLRIALVSLGDIRAAGRDVTVARYQAAPGVDYAMFAGGGVSWAETQMKQGHRSLAPAPAGTTPDLTGLSCRWSHMAAQNGMMLSVVIQPVRDVPGQRFARLCESVVTLAGQLRNGGHPVPPEGPGSDWPPPGARLEAQATHGEISVKKRRRQVLVETFIAWLLIRTGLKLGGFDPRHYQRTVGRNADFRKFEDGLKMTLDCDEDTYDKLKEVLERAQDAGIARFGLYRQDEAMMTCIVPSIMTDDHVHFVDGATGGYTQAAQQIKSAGQT